MEPILNLTAGLLLFTLLSAQHAAGQAEVGPGSADEEAIRRVVATYVETWNRSDMDAWGRLFTHDVDYVNRAGGWWRSNRENVEGHRTIHDALIERGARLVLDARVAEIALLSPDIALAHVETHGSGPTPSGEEREMRGMMTLVMVKRDGEWLIRALQNTLVEPVPLAGQPRAAGA